MWLSPEEARSDFILAVTAVLIGGGVAELLGNTPIVSIYPSGGWPYLVLSMGWIVLLGAIPAVWLARYRGDLATAFGVGAQDRGGAIAGLVVAAPLLVGYLVPVVFTGSPAAVGRALLGRVVSSNPLVGSVSVSDRLFQLGAVPLLALGSWLFGAFLVTRAKDAFRSRDADVTEMLRSVGLAGVGAALVLGLLDAIRIAGSLGNRLLVAVVLLVVVLLTDQYVPSKVGTTRAALAAPMIAVLVMWVWRTGGLFGGDLLTGLYAGTVAAVVVLCAGSLILSRRGVAGAILLVAAAIYPVGDLPMHATGLSLFIPVSALIP